MSQTIYETGQGTVKVSLERRPDGAVTATVGDRTYELTATPQADGSWGLEYGDRRVTVYTAREGQRRFVQVADGPVYALQVAEANPRRRSGAGSQTGQLTAQMPGQVVEVLVSVGDSVMAGQPLVILEAMKMEIRIAAPADGTVGEVFVKKGDVVERDQQLLVIG